jgi:hypothetical protein
MILFTLNYRFYSIDMPLNFVSFPQIQISPFILFYAQLFIHKLFYFINDSLINDLR